MKLEEVKKIKQTTTETEVNDYLDKGYKIMKIFSTKVVTSEVEQVMPCYVLGLPK